MLFYIGVDIVEIYDLAVQNGLIYQEGNFIKGNIYVSNGIIKKITKEIHLAKEIYDAKGNYVLPGFIDPHVHFDLKVNNGRESADDFQSGSISAAYGGVTTIIDFLDPVKNVEEMKTAYDRRLFEARTSFVDYGFHSTIANFDEDEEYFVDEIKKRGMCSIKFFTNYSSSNRKTYLKTISKLLKVTQKDSVMLLSHSENDELITEGKYPISSHEENRPSSSEIIEALTLAEMIKIYGGKLYLVHVSSGQTVERLKSLYRELLGDSLFIESCPQYFYLDKENYLKENGYLYTMAPPLRSKEEIECLKENIDFINTIGTDHCPFMAYEKDYNSLDKIPMGIGGIEHSFNLMYSLFGEKIIDKFTVSAAKLHGMYPEKGIIAEGSHGDLVIFNPFEEFVIEKSHSQCDYDLYRGMKVKGRVLTTICGGRIIIKDGKFQGKGSGKYVVRKY